MNTPVLVVGIVAVSVVLLVAAMIARRQGETTADDVMERMGRFATREEFLSVSDGSGGKHAAEQGGPDDRGDCQGRAESPARPRSLLARADVRMTVGEFLLMRIRRGRGGFRDRVRPPLPDRPRVGYAARNRHCTSSAT